MSQDAYQNLTGMSKETAILRDTAALLSWDQETYLPARGVAYRATEMAYLSGKAHELFTAEQVGDWIAECESCTPSNPGRCAVTERRG